MKYKKIKYPDGQISVELLETESYEKDVYTINERINSYEDLFYIKAISEVLRRAGIIELNLFIPCLFGQRSDRRFQECNSFDLKIITDFINSCNFNNVYIFDTHSDISLALINNSFKKSSFIYVKEAIRQINKELIIISPDTGSYKKCFEYGEKLNLPVVCANKYRDLDGEISLIFTGDVSGKDCLIVDDLCSRGGTFIKLSKELKEKGAKNIYLYISHFEGGCEEYKQTINNLLRPIDGIYTTNSFREFDKEDFKKINIQKVI